MIHLGLVLSEGVSVKDVEAVQVRIDSYVLRRRTARKQGIVLPFKQIVVISFLLLIIVVSKPMRDTLCNDRHSYLRVLEKKTKCVNDVRFAIHSYYLG